MTDHQRTELFEQHIDLARHLAHRASRIHRIPIEELVEEADSIMGSVVADWDTYDATRCKPTSWLYRKISWGLSNYCIRDSRLRKLDTIPEASDLHPLATENPIGRMIRTLGDDARTVVGIIVWAPMEIVEELDFRAPVRSRNVIEGFLRGRGWTDKRIGRAFGEVASCLAA